MAEKEIEKTVAEVTDSSNINQSGPGATKGKAGLPNSKDNGESMNTIDPKNGPSSKAEVVKWVADYTAGLTVDGALAFYNKVKAEYEAGDATNSGNNNKTSNAASIKTHKEDLDALFAGADLSEEAKASVATIFEAAVGAAVTVEVARIEEETETKLVEATAIVKEELTTKVDQFLSHLGEEWLTKNEVAVVSSLQVEALDSFMTGLKGLFAEHYVAIPEDKVDVVEALATQVEDLEAKLDEEIKSAVDLRAELNALKSKEVLESALEGLTDTQKDRVRALAEEVSFTSVEEFTSKVSTLKEAVVGVPAKGTVLKEDKMNDPVELEEKAPAIDPQMQAYLNAMRRTIKK